MNINTSRTKKALSAALAATLLLSLASCGSSGSASNQGFAGNPGSASNSAGNPDAGGSVTTVTLAHTQAYYPYDYVTADGQSDGYEVAVLKAVDELLPEFQFQFVGTNDDDLLLGIESGKYDGGTKGVWWTADREKSYLFPEYYIGTSITGITFRAEQAGEITDFASSPG